VGFYKKESGIFTYNGHIIYCMTAVVKGKVERLESEQFLNWIEKMSLPPWKKDHPWMWLSQLNRNGPALILRHYKRKPAFRPKAPEPKSPSYPRTDPVKSKFEATRGKLMHLLRRFDEVNSIIDGSRRRINPFQPVALIELEYADIERQMKEGIYKWSEYDFEESEDVSSLENAMENQKLED